MLGNETRASIVVIFTSQRDTPLYTSSVVGTLREGRPLAIATFPSLSDQHFFVSQSEYIVLSELDEVPVAKVPEIHLNTYSGSLTGRSPKG